MAAEDTVSVSRPFPHFFYSHLLSILEGHGRAEHIADLWVLFEKVDISLQYILTPEAIIRGNEPEVAPSGVFNAFVKIVNEAEVFLISYMDYSRVLELFGYLRRIVRRTIIHDERFEIAVGLRENGVHAVAKKVRKLIARNDKTDLRVHYDLFPTSRSVVAALFPMSRQPVPAQPQSSAGRAAGAENCHWPSRSGASFDVHTPRYKNIPGGWPLPHASPTLRRPEGLAKDRHA